MGARPRAGARGRGAGRRAGARRRGSPRGGGRGLTLLIREAPARELTVATRILAHRGLLAPDGRVAALVGSEVVYLAGREVTAGTMTPYDVCALRLGDGSTLAGTPSDDAVLYLAALQSRDRRAAALTADGIVSAPDLSALLEGLCRMPWVEAEAEARGAGALIGAYPSDTA